MNNSILPSRIGMIIVSLVCGALAAAPAWSADRPEARDTRQEGRQDARDTKDACKEGDSSRAECRQGKRDDKQEARDTAKDVKR